MISSLLYAVREAGCDVANTGIQAFVVRGWGPWRRQERLAKINAPEKLIQIAERVASEAQTAAAKK